MTHTSKNKTKRKKPANSTNVAHPDISAWISAVVDASSTVPVAAPSSSAAKLGLKKDYTKLPMPPKLSRLDSKATASAAARPNPALGENDNGVVQGNGAAPAVAAKPPVDRVSQAIKKEEKPPPCKEFRGKTRPNRQAMLNARARTAESTGNAPGAPAPSKSAASHADADVSPSADGGHHVTTPKVTAADVSKSVGMDVDKVEADEKCVGTMDLIQAASDMIKCGDEPEIEKKNSDRKWMSDWKYRKMKIKEKVAERAARPHRGYTYIGGLRPIPSHIVPPLNNYVVDEILRVLIRLNPRGKTKVTKKPQTTARVAIAFKTAYPTPHRIEYVLARMEPTYMLRRAIKAHMTPDPRDYKEQEREKKRKLNMLPLLQVIKKHSNPNLLDTTKHHPLNMAAMMGKVDILEWWFRSYPNRRSTYKGTKAADVASEKGYLHVLEWWRRSGLRVRASNKAVDLASKNGHLDVLHWWYKHYKTRFTSSSLAVDLASRMGHMHVLNFWFHQTKGFYYLRYSAKATTWAALQNRIHVLEWWRKIGAAGVTLRPFKYSVRAMDVASVHNNVGVLEWFRHCGLPIRFSPKIVLSSKAAPWWINSGLILPEFAVNVGEMTAESKITIILAICTVDPRTLPAEELNRTEPREHPARLVFRYKRDASTRVFVEVTVPEGHPRQYVELKHPKFEKREKARRSGMYSSDVYTPYQMYQQMVKQDLVTQAEDELVEEYKYAVDILKARGTRIVTGPAAATAPATAAPIVPTTTANGDAMDVDSPAKDDAEAFDPDLKAGHVYAMNWAGASKEPLPMLPTIVRGVRRPKEVANIRRTFAMGFVTTTDGIDTEVEVDISLPYIRCTKLYRTNPVLKAALFEEICRQIAMKNRDLFVTLTSDFEFQLPVLDWTDWLVAYLIGPGKDAKSKGTGSASDSIYDDPTAPITHSGTGPLAALLLGGRQEEDGDDNGGVAEQEHIPYEEEDDLIDEDDDDMESNHGSPCYGHGHAASEAWPGYPSLYPPNAPRVGLFLSQHSHAAVSSNVSPSPTIAELMSYPTASASTVTVLSQHYHHHPAASNPAVPYASDPSFSLVVQNQDQDQEPPKDELAMLLLHLGHQVTPVAPQAPEQADDETQQQPSSAQDEPNDEYLSQQPQLDHYQTQPDQYYRPQHHQPDLYHPTSHDPDKQFPYYQRQELNGYGYPQERHDAAWSDDQDVDMDEDDDANEPGLLDPTNDAYSHANIGGDAYTNFHNMYYGYSTAGGDGDSRNWEEESDDEDMSDEEDESGWIDNEHLQEGY
ncbi:hypothetical protein BCR44DRAFT_38144 [Catenaria anguillulae PL171]|uniref:Uncharacterized protein n=1 Tax=Catenaria anguillulae PL171 TaxID=765915 RepID=A0A1Y2I312_9FUNG|nr:hypothetical protein BCR44DRAFT_38144 [Catenaria anguillulae PL171]